MKGQPILNSRPARTWVPWAWVIVAVGIAITAGCVAPRVLVTSDVVLCDDIVEWDLCRVLEDSAQVRKFSGSKDICLVWEATGARNNPVTVSVYREDRVLASKEFEPTGDCQSWKIRPDGPGNYSTEVSYRGLVTPIDWSISTPTPAKSILFQEDFDSNENNWYLASGTYERYTKEEAIVDGKYRLDIWFDKSSGHQRNVPGSSYRDFFLSVDSQIWATTEPDQAYVYITFRHLENSDRYYVVFDNRGVRIGALRGGKWVNVTAQVPTSAFSLGSNRANTFGVMVKGSFIAVFANGHELLSVNDTAISGSGRVGLGVGASAAQAVTAKFDNLRIWSFQPGSKSGSLVHEDDHRLETKRAGVNERDFFAEAVFYTPYSTSQAPWDIGLLFRDRGKNDQLRLVIQSSGIWMLRDEKADPPLIARGRIPNLRTNVPGANRLALLAQQDQGFFWINGRFVDRLALSSRTTSGDVRVATELMANPKSAAIAGTVTEYENFTVCPLPPGASDN